MKGLIFKDIFEIRIQIIVGAIIALYPNAMLMIGFSNLMSETVSVMGEAELINSMFMLFLNFATIVPFTSLLLNTLTNDVSSGWAKICRTMPVSSEQVVLSKIISTAILVGGFTLIAIIINIITIFRTENVIPEVLIAAPFCIGLIQMINLTPVFPISLKLGVKSANSIYLALMIILVIFTVIFLFGVFSNDISMTFARILLYGIIPVTASLVIFISYKCSRNLIAKDL